MKDPDASWQQMTICQLPACPDHRCNPEFDLMPIRQPLDPDIGEGHRDLFSLAHAQGNAFIDEPGIALRPAKGVAQKLAGIKYIIEEPDLAKIKVAREMESEQIILQCIGDQLDKFDLAR